MDQVGIWPVARRGISQVPTQSSCAWCGLRPRRDDRTAVAPRPRRRGDRNERRRQAKLARSAGVSPARVRP